MGSKTIYRHSEEAFQNLELIGRRMAPIEDSPSSDACNLHLPLRIEFCSAAFLLLALETTIV